MGLILAFLKRLTPGEIAGIALTVAFAALMGVQVHKTRAAQHELAATNAKLVTAQQTIINYQQAAEKARQADAQNRARAEAEQQAVVERTKEDYEARIARARTDAQRLRDQLARPANPGSPGAAPVSDHRGAGPSSPGASEDHGLSIDERLIATEQAIQLDALISYVNGILKVDMNGTGQEAGRQSPARPRP